MSGLEYLQLPWTDLAYEPPWYTPEHYEPIRYRFREDKGFDLRGYAIGGEPGSVIGYLPKDLVDLLDRAAVGVRIYQFPTDIQLDEDGALRGWPRE